MDAVPRIRLVSSGNRQRKRGYSVPTRYLLPAYFALFTRPLKSLTKQRRGDKTEESRTEAGELAAEEKGSWTDASYRCLSGGQGGKVGL